MYSLHIVVILNSDFEKSLWLGEQKFQMYSFKNKVWAVIVHKYDDVIDHILKAIIDRMSAAVGFTDTPPKLQTTDALSSIERVSSTPVDTCGRSSSGWNEAICYPLCWIMNIRNLSNVTKHNHTHKQNSTFDELEIISNTLLYCSHLLYIIYLNSFLILYFV